MNIQDYCTLIQDSVYVSLGRVELDVVDELMHKQYDQALVKDHSGHIIGIIETEQLSQMLNNSLELFETDEQLYYATLSFPLSLVETLDTLSKNRAALVVYHDAICGLITISDLNRHPFRAMLYALFAKLEAELAILVEREFKDPWQWIQLLSEDAQASLLGYWELSKRRNVDIGPVAATTLSQLLTIPRKGSITDKLGYKSKKEFENIAGSIPDLRNRVMHPVRPLILDVASVTKVKETVDGIINLIQRVESVNAK